MPRFTQLPSSDLLNLVFDTLKDDRAPLSDEDVAQRARIRRERVRRMLVRSVFAGVAQ